MAPDFLDILDIVLHIYVTLLSLTGRGALPSWLTFRLKNVIISQVSFASWVIFIYNEEINSKASPQSE